MDDGASKECGVLYDLMRRFWSPFGLQMSNELQRRGLNTTQYMAMVALSSSGETSMSRLSSQLHVTVGATTSVMDKLIRSGLASRSRGTDDRRVVRVKLEPKALQTLQEIEEKAAGFMTAVLNELGPDRSRQFIESYRMIVRIAEAREKAETPEEKGPYSS